MRRVARRFEDRVEDVVKRTAAAVDRTAVFATPVDTGRARAGWLPSIGSPVLAEPVSVSPTGAAPIAAAQSTVARFRIGAGGIFLTNVVPYIGRLNAGSSAQAPAGMVPLAIQAGRLVAAAARPLAEATSGD